MLLSVGLAGCGMSPSYEGMPLQHLSDRDCLTRAMYFESNRSSREGMLAVGTVVMNRVQSGQYPHTVCGVVGQRGQFAYGALWKRMSPREAATVAQVADEVMAGARHPALGPNAMFFHTAGYHFPYHNMHYVLVAGGNAFYYKSGRPSYPAPDYEAPAPQMVASAPPAYTPPPVTAFAASEDVDSADRNRLTAFLSGGHGLY